MKFIITVIAFVAYANHSADAQDCHFKYWEVIPSNTCKIYYLPDFTFASVPQDADAQDTIKRFCANYEIVSKFGKQRVGYCYTGEGDRSGPTFKLGDEKWHFQDKKKKNVYFADLNFEGCYKGQKATGVVFGTYGWKEAPQTITRSLPLEGKIAKCGR